MRSFEEQIAALESVVEKLERGELSLDESVKLFEEGMRLSRACREQLDLAEGRVEVLMESVAASGAAAQEAPEWSESEADQDDEAL